VLAALPPPTAATRELTAAASCAKRDGRSCAAVSLPAAA
jgi:hypothetical protein